MESALSNLVKEYVAKELKYNPPPEEDSSVSPSTSQSKCDNPEGIKKPHHTDPKPLSSDEQYILDLQLCLEQKGVLQEMQTFLRQKLVLILEEKWPGLSETPPSQTIQPAVITLMQDFLCCRKLLYTFSVMSSELGITYSSKVQYGKLACLEAERLLEEFEIRKDSKLSQSILKMYSDMEYTSLIECLIQALSWFCDKAPPPLFSNCSNDVQLFNGTCDRTPSVATDTQLGNEGADPVAESNPHIVQTTEGSYLEERLVALQKQLQESKEHHLRELKRFQDTEVAKIKKELQSEMQIELITKESQLLQNYNAKLDTMIEELEKTRKKVEQEKTDWLAAKELEISSVCKNCSGKLQSDLANSNTRESSSYSNQNISTENIATMTVSEETNEETSLRICELQEEIKRLTEERDFYASRSRAETEQSVKKHKKDANVSTLDLDSISFVKYNVSPQSEESTKRELYLENSYEMPQQSRAITMPGKSDALQVEISSDSDLVDFLAQSRQRCNKIEHDTKQVQNRLAELRYRRSRPSTPMITMPKHSTTLQSSFADTSNSDISYSIMSKNLLSQLNSPRPPIVPVIQPSMILRRPLLEWKQQQAESSIADPSTSLNLLDLSGPISMSLDTVPDSKNEFIEKQSLFNKQISDDLNTLNPFSQKQLCPPPKSEEVAVQSTIDQAERETIYSPPPRVSKPRKKTKPSVKSEVLPKKTPIESTSCEPIDLKKSLVQDPTLTVVSCPEENPEPPASDTSGIVSSKPSPPPKVKKGAKKVSVSFETIPPEDETISQQRSSDKEKSSKSSKTSSSKITKKEKLTKGKVDASLKNKTQQLKSSILPKKEAAPGASSCDPKVVAETHKKSAQKKVTSKDEGESKSPSLPDSSPEGKSSEDAAADADKK